MSVAPTALLRPGLLDGRALLLAHAPESEFGSTVSETCSALGASIRSCSRLGAEEADLEAELEALWSESQGLPDVLVVDLASAFAAAGGAPAERLVRCMEQAWRVTNAVATSAFLPRDEREQRGGRVIYVAPPTGAGEHAEAVRAGVENLARTLSVEWARFAVTTVAIAPGPASAAEDLAALIAFLASAAGEYYSGCQLDLRGV